MFSKLLLLICLAFTSAVLAQPYNTINGRRTAPIFPSNPATYDINLDLSYEDQFKAVIADFEDPLVSFINSLDLSSKVPFHLLDMLDYSIVADYNQDFAEQIKAISNLTNLSFTEITLLNLIYDVTAQCTSIVIQDNDDNIYHGRNLDFPFAPYLSKLIFHGRYFTNGTLLYEATSLAGYTGLITGMKPNAYSFSIDQYVLRNNATMWDNLIIAILDVAQGFKDKLSPPLLARIGFETIPDFDGLVEYLKNMQTLSRVFYIVAGAQPGQGVVITKERESVQNATTLDISSGKWYVAQTNYVGNAPDPLDDNRETAARNYLNSIGRDAITKDILLSQVMSLYPIFNNETIHTSIMQPGSGYINTTLYGWGNSDYFGLIEESF